MHSMHAGVDVVHSKHVDVDMAHGIHVGVDVVHSIHVGVDRVHYMHACVDVVQKGSRLCIAAKGDHPTWDWCADQKMSHLPFCVCSCEQIGHAGHFIGYCSRWSNLTQLLSLSSASVRIKLIVECTFLWKCGLSPCLSGDFILLCLQALQHPCKWNPPRSALRYFITLVSLHCLWIFSFSYFIASVPAEDCVRIPTGLPCQDWLDNLMVFMAVLFLVSFFHLHLLTIFDGCLHPGISTHLGREIKFTQHLLKGACVPSMNMQGDLSIHYRHL